MFGWGSTVHGELGLGGVEEEHILVPKDLEFTDAKKVVEVACGPHHTLFLTKEGKVYSCGNNDYGQLGHDQPRKRPRPVSLLDAHRIKKVACGMSHSLALNEWGQVFAWGSNSDGQLGLQLNVDNQSTPKIIKTLTTRHIIQIACGANHNIALASNGEIFSWGSNTYGQLGVGTKTQLESTPIMIGSLSGVPISFIACGFYHTFVLSKSGGVFGWGKNTTGQLGLNSTDESISYPTQLRTLRNIKVRFVACGQDFSTFLTNEGGVLTCGSGAYGQLGHGSLSNEMLPKQVIELMGSTITQIQCGRQHTIAYVPSRERVYSFGLGGSGQLGTKKPVNSSTPQVVLGPWVSQNILVKKIFAGGDHCLVSVKSIGDVDNDSETVYDSRIYLNETQISVIDKKLVDDCLHVPASGNVDLELLGSLETCFKSLNCFNASFLLANNEHYYCTSKHHGVNVKLAEEIFNSIARFENESIKNLIWTCITEDLLFKLTPSPPDVEALRIYLTLPLYHEFYNPKQYLKLHKPFAGAVLNLQTQAARVVNSWWSSMSCDYFEKLVTVFKDVAYYIIRGQQIKERHVIHYDLSLVIMLNMLQLLNKLNHSIDGLKVPYETFHMSDLIEILDVRIDYISWLTDESNKFFLCNYPFIFDAQAKTLLLEADQRIQMEMAMKNARIQACMHMFLVNQGLFPLNQFLVLNVNRETIVTDSIRELMACTASDLKKPLRVKFFGEEAEDAGGVTKEFFMLLLREILDPKYGMFQEYEETRTIWFSDHTFEDEVHYFLIGIICGLAIYNFTIINIPFPLVLYKKLLKETVVLSDLKSLSPSMANSLQQLLDYDGDDVENVFGLTFEISRDVFGEIKNIELKPDGGKINVTKENKGEYVDLYVDYIFNKSVKEHFNAFRDGFMKVCGGRVLELFHSQELMAVVTGNENYDWHALEEAAEYKGDYKSSDQTIRWFWEVIHELPLADKKKFLLFLTGSDRIPIQGMKAIKILIQPTTDDKYLPVAHTCFNLLDLPRYKTKERLKYKLLQAIQQIEGFSLV
ncbi:probable E3 ubiquitin-protein ligase HERC4 isoform X2 [Onthophagus taurus]|uniref:probable E3 ubiquitin-protein ligase HERC4 isoform X2 n=1 Tax=Onthophagus taurus TaxID=166361 RepID=UPI000C2008E8|nr:probable E3 ubiquitin-protein ligase HERC4 isoform X2 [Onthophagus taurus]